MTTWRFVVRVLAAVVLVLFLTRQDADALASDADNILKHAEILLPSAAAIRDLVDVEMRFTVSAGVATAYPHSDTLDSTTPITLLREADAALYVAKTTGRDRVCVPEASIV